MAILTTTTKTKLLFQWCTKNFRFCAFLFVFGLLSTQVHAQFTFNYNDSIQVIHFGTPLINPWAGGINYAQLSDFDYDQDGDLDLFDFDRSSDNLRDFAP